MTPSIARDRTSISPLEDSSDMVTLYHISRCWYSQTPTTKVNVIDREKEDGKRSLSISSSNSPEMDTREREKDKKGRKNSVFGNLFKKKQKKLSRDEDNSREQDTKERNVNVPAAVLTEANDNDDLLRNDWTNISATESGDYQQSSAINQSRGVPADRTTYMSPEPLSPNQVTRLLSFECSLLIFFSNSMRRLPRNPSKQIPIFSLPALVMQTPISKPLRFHGLMHHCIHFWKMILAFGMCLYWYMKEAVWGNGPILIQSTLKLQIYTVHVPFTLKRCLR